MDCKTASSLLESYLDAELDRADARALETHVDSCADCNAALRKLDELRRALRDKALRYAAPQGLRERIRSAVIGADMPTIPTSRARRHALPNWLRYAAACVLAFGAGGISVHVWTSGQDAASGQTQIERDLFASHWRALAATSPVDVVSSDRHTVKPWFAGKVAQAPIVRDFVEQGFPLVGGRIDYVGTQRLPVLVYRHGQHLIDVFVLPSTPAASADESQGTTLSTVKLGDMSAAIISDMDAGEVATFRQLLADAR